MVRFDIDRFPPSVTPGIGTDGFSAGVPVGIGVSLKLTNHLAFELNGRYTYALSDELNGTVLKKGNDGFLSFMAGLTLDSFGGKPAGAKPLEVKKWVPPSIEDTDGDGLKDADEISRYQTDPSKASSKLTTASLYTRQALFWRVSVARWRWVAAPLAFLGWIFGTIRDALRKRRSP